MGDYRYVAPEPLVRRANRASSIVLSEWVAEARRSCRFISTCSTAMMATH